MKISKIKNQISKIQIKNKIFLIFTLIFLSALPVSAFAHETGEVHEEPPASIDPVVAVIIVVVVIGVLGFLLWKFVLNKKEAPPAQPK